MLSADRDRSTKCYADRGRLVTRGAAGALLALACAGCVDIPNRSGGVSVKGARYGTLIQLSGDERGGMLHVLVLKPPGTTPGSNGGVFRMDYWSTTDTVVWRDVDGERTFEITYDGSGGMPA
jgi:hypothetical protein